MCAEMFNWLPTETAKQTPEQTIICLAGRGVKVKPKPTWRHYSVEQARAEGIIK